MRKFLTQSDLAVTDKAALRVSQLVVFVVPITS